ncbi:MAG TPA: proline dehydrogenase family protein [Bryobacteraceae bacterium]|jgi:proline dehydrogenase
MMRRFLLFLSGQQRVRRWMETSSTTHRLVRRFVAGDNLNDALHACRRVNAEHISATLDYLGEHVRTLEEAALCRDTYQRALHAVLDNSIDANVSLKLTQFGIDFSQQACTDNVAALVNCAAAAGSFVRVDMESSEYTERTLRLVEHLHARYGAVGTVIQAYLHRSAEDIRRLCAKGVRVRLCKGAYLEPPEVAFQHKADVDRNYLDLARVLLAKGNYPAIATHDERIIREIIAYTRENSISADRFEFQMLYGIRADLQRKLVTDGYRLRLYIPYGEAWYPYFMRRLAERPANLIFLARNLFRD